jgi:PAT family beta-lactamase induction signal transducer AmpG
MRLPFTDLLASRRGRLTAFFMLYMTEGIPLGFTATAIATQMRRQGLGPEAIGAFVGSLYLPWAFKWIAGPIVDTFSSDRFGRRRTWIILMQIGMMATLLFALPIDYTKQLSLFTMIILVHNAFCATQDVAIDALAVNVLHEDERGTANGFMFAGASIGQAVGGSLVLFLAAVVPFRLTYFFVVGMIGLVTLFIALPLKEPKGPPRATPLGDAMATIGRDLVVFIREVWEAFTGSRGALIGLLYAILPAGAYALGLALQSNLAVELGLSDSKVGQLALYSTVISAVGCVVGGWLSDRFGRRKTLGFFLVCTALPTVWLAWAMYQAGWIHALDPRMAHRPVPSAALIQTFWAACLVYNVFQGLYYGIQSALFMDITTPRVAATQFTAYMAMLNLTISYTAFWQGKAIARLGYPKTLALDATLGMIGVILLPLLRPRPRAAKAASAIAPGEPIPEAVP